MHKVAIVQARMGSSRLPGKVLKMIEGKSMLERVVERVKSASLLDQVVVATTQSEEDLQVVEACKALGVEIFCGDVNDVLNRYCGAAGRYDADLVIRITADCPLIDPDEIDHVLREFLAGDADYASNFIQRTYPRGLDTEVTTRQVLEQAARESSKPYERIHVTPYIYQHPEKFRLLSVTGKEDHSRHRWTVDEPKDLEFIQFVYQAFGGRALFSWKDVIAYLAVHPELIRINADVAQKPLEQN